MNKPVRTKSIILFACLFLSVQLLYSQDSANAVKPKIYIECSYCWSDFLKDELKFLDFVRHREESDIFLQVLKNYNASNGAEYTLDFLGKNQFTGMNDTVKFNTNINMSSDDERIKLLKYIKIGLIKYLLKTQLMDNMSIDYNISQLNNNVIEKDNWDNWFISMRGQSYFSGQNTGKDINLWLSMSAKRLTEDFKTGLSVGTDFNEDSFHYDDINITSISRSYYSNMHAIWSVGKQWSIGTWAGFYRSTYSNYDFNIDIGPGIEYNFFPYSEYARNELRINYKIQSNYNKYFDTTIYNKLKEFYFENSLNATFEMIKSWGNFSISAGFNSHLNDFNRNSINLNTDFSIWIFKGFSINFTISYTAIQNQLNVAKGNAPIEEVLLRRRQLEQSYSYWGSLGISYSFGSIYNNIVNTRFGG